MLTSFFETLKAEQRFKKLYRFLITSSLLLLLTACATIKPQTPHFTTIPWVQRQAQLQVITDFKVRGVLAVTDSQTHKGFNANFYWQQMQDQYQLLLFGPLGSNAVRLDGNAAGVTLTTSNGQKIQARHAEQLLQRELGFTLPINDFKAWIRGLPASDTPIINWAFDRYQHLYNLQQAGWQITYLRYQTINRLDLPAEITAYTIAPHLQVKMVIQDWTL